MPRRCVVVCAGVGKDRDAADDGCYDLLDVAGTAEQVGAAIAEALAKNDLWNREIGCYTEAGRPIWVSVVVRIEPEGYVHPEEE